MSTRRQSRVLRAVASAAVVACSTAWCHAEEPFADLDFDAALAAAKKADKLVMIDFYTTWCPPCKMLDRLTWPDEKVKAWLKSNAIALKVDAEKNRPLAAKFAIQAYPTIVFIKPDGSELNRMLGFRDAGGFLSAAEAIRTGKAPPGGQPTGRPNRPDPAKDPMARYKQGQELARQGKAAEALVEYLWCFDHGLDAGPAFYGVRVSYLLGSIIELGRSHPPALEALRERRDAAEKSLMAEWAKPQSALEVVRINQELKEESRTLKLYDELAKRGESSAGVRKMMTPFMLDQLIAARRYDDVISGSDDLVGEIDEQIGRYEQAALYMSNGAKAGAPADPARVQAQQNIKRNLLSTCGKYYEALLGAGKPEQAIEVADRLLELDPSADTLTVLADAAGRAGKEDIVKTWRDRAAAAKPAGEPGRPASEGDGSGADSDSKD